MDSKITEEEQEKDYEITEKEKEIINDILGITRPENEFYEKYNKYYNSYDFWKTKFPKGYDRIPEMNLVIKKIKENNINNSPLKEIEERSKINIDD
jgi:hypothetical protein